MKAYLMVTGSLFGLAGIAHLFGLLRELLTDGPNHVLGNPHFVVTSIVIFAVGAGLGVWALLLLRGTGRGAAF
jgi:hypothetical protein